MLLRDRIFKHLIMLVLLSSKQLSWTSWFLNDQLLVWTESHRSRKKARLVTIQCFVLCFHLDACVNELKGRSSTKLRLHVVDKTTGYIAYPKIYLRNWIQGETWYLSVLSVCG
jgi:hypothetical protein